MGSQALRVIIWVNLAWTPQRELGKHQRYGDLAFNNYGFTPNKTNWGELPSMAHEKWWLFKHQTWEDSQQTRGLKAQVGLYSIHGYTTCFNADEGPIRIQFVMKTQTLSLKSGIPQKQWILLCKLYPRIKRLDDFIWVDWMGLGIHEKWR